MKLEIQEDNIILIFKESEIININFDDIDALEKYFRTILLKLKEIYDIDIRGFYNIYVYIDKQEGIVLKLEKEQIDYYDSFHQIEMRIIKEEVPFLYEVEDLLTLPYHNLDIYIYQEKFYVKPKKRMYCLYEFGKLVYEDTKKIIEIGNKMTIL